MFKDLLNKGKCLVGLHQGEWRYVALDQCAQVQVCELCQTESERTVHHWPEWGYVAADRCEQQRACGRCREIEQRTEHTWDGWAYLGPDACTQTQVCDRCGEPGGQTQVAHAWTEWRYSEANRAPVRVCRRCRESMSCFPRQELRAATDDAFPAEELSELADVAVDHDHEAAPSQPAADEVAAVMQVFRSGDPAAMTAFIEACPTSPVKTVALLAVSQPYLESNLMGLNMLAESYARGAGCEWGVTLARAAYLLAQEGFEATGDKRLQSTAGASAITCALGLQNAGRHTELLEHVSKALDWLDRSEHRDYEEHEQHRHVLDLFRMQAHLELADYARAEPLLDDPRWQRLPPEYQSTLADLRERYNQTAHTRATELPTARSESETFEQGRRAVLKNLEIIESNPLFVASPELQQLVQRIRSAQDPSGFTSMSEWALQSRSLMDELTDVVSGHAGGGDHLHNRQRIRNASLVLADPDKGHDPEALEASIAALIEGRDWGKAHGFAEDENDALWALGICYGRTGRLSEAIEALQALRANLEAVRSKVTDPLERAGAFRTYPYLFASLCGRLYDADRRLELLDAIEGAKGRVAADVLTQKQGQIVPDRPFSDAVQDLPPLMQRVGAHYLSYFVDDEMSYAVFVVRDGTLHTQDIPIGTEKLRRWADEIDPKTWGRSKMGLLGAAKTGDLPDRLRPLVSWLEPLAAAGVLRQDDHICYSPDDELHLVPLHYVPFLGKPLVEYVSLSRIHGALALLALLRNEPSRPREFTAVEVPARRDLKDAETLAAFGRVSGWLAEHLPGRVVKGPNVDLAAIGKLELSERVVHFATHGTFPHARLEHRDPNPYRSAGLVLAKDGQLPDLEDVSAGTADDTLLSPERALDLDLADSHLTLQACVSGLAKEGVGGDALGLEWAFLQAGAASLLSSHWNVSASASSAFSIGFYRRWLLDGMSRAGAWRETVLEVIDSPTPAAEQPQPYYWAAFSLSGDWR